jgi:predicted metal-dependent peptidase
MTIRDVVTALLLEEPYYGCVAAAVSFVPDGAVQTMKMASGEKLRIAYNPAWFAALPEREKRGAVVHELLHVILLHPFRRGERENALWSAACDMAVNELSEEDRLPKDAVTVAAVEKRLRRTLARNGTAESYYDILTDVIDSFSFFTSDEAGRAAV